MDANHLIAEQQKIQRQIEALQRRLAPLGSGTDEPVSSTDQSDDDGSEDSDSLQIEVVQEDIMAEKERIQREIEDLEQTLGPDVSHLEIQDDQDDDSADSSDEDSSEELNLPHTVETCLQINLVYQQILEEKLAELERLLRENQEQQKEITAQTSGSASQSGTSASIPQKLFLGYFMKPYFKDKVTSLGPPANSETRDKMNKSVKSFDDTKIKRWEDWQKTLLVKSVVSDTMKRLSQPKLSKLEYLNQKLSKANEMEKQIIKKQITEIEKEIEDISAMKEEQLVGSRYDDHDWEKISNVDFEGIRKAQDIRRFWENYLHPSINKTCWKEEEIEKLRGIVSQHHCRYWDRIAEDLGTNRTAFMCLQTYQRYINPRFKKKVWSKEEDEVLRELVDKMRIGNFIPYTQMSYFMEGREAAQLIYRWTQVLDPSLKKGHWSKEEDEMLLKAVAKYGVRDWWKIRGEVPGRTDGQCRDRYLDCLTGNVKKGRWNEEEEALLIKLVEKYGAGRWAKIASEIPNRIDSQCLQKWKAMTGYTLNGRTRRCRKPIIGEKMRRKKRRKKVSRRKDLEKATSEEEDEEELVLMDSEDEAESDQDGKVREKYVQPKIDEWISKVPSSRLRLGPRVMRVDPKILDRIREANSRLGRIRSENSIPLKRELVGVRSTILDELGSPLEVIMEMEPYVPSPEKDSQTENEMVRVSVTEVKNLIRNTGSSGTKPMTCLPVKAGLQGSLNGRKLEGKGQRSHASASGSSKVARMNKLSLNRQLLLAVVPWIGNVLMPLTPEPKKTCEADVGRAKAEVLGLASTPVFKLLLRLLRIDAEGCKKVIEKRRMKESSTHVQVVLPPPTRGGPQKRTVAHMLHEKRCQENKSRGATEMSPSLVPCVVLPRTLLLTQSLLQGLTAQPAASQPSNDTGSEGVGEDALPRKRIRKPTEKALALRSKRKESAAKKGRVQPVLPKNELVTATLTWIMTPNGLLPIPAAASNLGAGAVLNQPVHAELTAGSERAEQVLRVTDTSSGRGVAALPQATLTLPILSPGVTAAFSSGMSSPAPGSVCPVSSKPAEQVCPDPRSPPPVSAPKPSVAQTSVTSSATPNAVQHPSGTSNTALPQPLGLPFLQVLHPNGPGAPPSTPILAAPPLQKKPSQFPRPGTEPLKASSIPQQSRSAPISLDPSLMFLEEESQVTEWMKGTRGVVVPHLDVTLPYLPPFVSSLTTLSALLQCKKVLEQAALQLVIPSAEREREAQLAGIRRLVAEKLGKNPAYQLLKARFLSCFTLPAFLATVPPRKRPTFLDFLTESSEEEGETAAPEIPADGDVELTSGQRAPLSTEEDDRTAVQFTGISTRRRRQRPIRRKV